MSSVTEQQREAWNKFSSGWRKWDKFVLGILEPIGKQLLDEVNLKISDILLDVSTGTGEPGLTAATKVAKVVATDVAEDMLEVARQNGISRNLNNFEVIAADAEKLPFDDNSFDSVVCRLGVMFFGNPQAGVNEMVRVLKPDRKLALAAWTEPAENAWATTASSVINKFLNITPPPADSPGLFRQSDEGKLTEMMVAADLENVKQTKISGEWIFDSPEQYWEFVTDVVAPVAIPLSTASDSIREDAKKAVLEATSVYTNDGKVVFSWGCWIAVGSKK